MKGTLKRSKAFQPSHQPLKHHPTLHLDQNRVTGPISFLNPTSAHFHPTLALENVEEKVKDTFEGETRAFPPKKKDEFKHERSVSAFYKWTSRNNRKGRHALVVSPQKPEQPKYIVAPVTSSLRELGRGLLRLVTEFPIWDVSYDVAVIFTIGSVIWCINAFFVWLPLVRPDTEFHNEILYGGGITAFIGATIFEIGSVLLLSEAINENRTGCLGWAVERAFSHEKEEAASSTLRLLPTKSHCTHHHNHRRKLANSIPSIQTRPHSPAPKSWTWIPSKSDLLTHHLYSIGFLASFFQLLGATIFWISGFTALPPIYNSLTPTLETLFFWTPQVIGGSGFIISGLLFMAETQRRWCIPAFGALGWHVGFWNLVGGVGFTLCPCFGYKGSSWAEYQSGLCTFWGSWAFLIGSGVQWYESLGKHPVEVDKCLAVE